MAALIAEMNSFVIKLSQLNSCGLNACVNFNAYGGRVYASLHADLGDLEAKDYPQPRKMQKPSRLRRRIRRRQAFRNSNQEQMPANEGICSKDSDQEVFSNKCEFSIADEADDVIYSSITGDGDTSEPISLIDFNEEAQAWPYSSDSYALTPKLSHQEAEMSPQMDKPSPAYQEDAPSQIEIQMYSMLKHITSRL